MMLENRNMCSSAVKPATNSRLTLNGTVGPHLVRPRVVQYSPLVVLLKYQDSILKNRVKNNKKNSNS